MTSRIAALEAYSKTHAATILELKGQCRMIGANVESISRDLHAAKVGGRMILSVALVTGGFIGWAINLLGRG